MSFKKTVLITGCSPGGIGSGLVNEFHSRGFHVVATGRNSKKLAQFEGIADINTETLDVTLEETIRDAVKRVHELTGGRGLDYLVNNSGFNASIELTKHLFDVNVFGVMAVTNAFLPLLIKAKGTIVTIGSTAGYYNASKAAIHSINEAMRIEFAPLGINAIVVVYPGRVATVMTASSDSNAPSPPLPSNSFYASINEKIQSKEVFGGLPTGEDPAQLASDVVGDVLGRRWWYWPFKKHVPTVILRGTGWRLAWLIPLFPAGLLDVPIRAQFGFNTIKPPSDSTLQSHLP
ncbi:MAG: hypothetical protein M1834_009599 [Cirrosporium novae-zelandiae]|nr:MAG: hypothetical protein M1834_009599 [Cirrosporium novae-zelandiae]